MLLPSCYLLPATCCLLPATRYLLPATCDLLLLSHFYYSLTRCFKDMPARFRQPRAVPPLPQLRRAWRLAGARQLFSGGRGSGAALHFHNAAYNVPRAPHPAPCTLQPASVYSHPRPPL